MIKLPSGSIKAIKKAIEEKDGKTLVGSLLIMAFGILSGTFLLSMIGVGIWIMISLIIENGIYIGVGLGAIIGIGYVIKWINGKFPPSPLPPPPDKRHIQKARADSIYPAMLKTVLMVFCDVSCYVGNALIKPFSMASIESPSHYDIDSIGVILFQFIIAKGEGGISASTLCVTIRRVLKQLLNNHSCAGLPTEPYRDSKGNLYDAVQCVGVYDCGGFFRCDFAITDENLVAILSSKAYIDLDSLQEQPISSNDKDF